MTHVAIDIDSINWDQYLNVQEGGQMMTDRFFVGQKYMRGYGVLGNIGRFLLPIAKNLASSVGNEGVAAGTRIMKDVAEGKDFTAALKEHSQKGLENLSEKLKQCGKGKANKKTTTLPTSHFTTSNLYLKGEGRKKRGKKKTILSVGRNISFYPPRPVSPTMVEPTLFKKRTRKRKPDQLDFF